MHKTATQIINHKYWQELSFLELCYILFFIALMQIGGGDRQMSSQAALAFEFSGFTVASSASSGWEPNQKPHSLFQAALL